MSDKVTRQRPQTTTFLKRGLSAYQPNALPLGQTGSHLCTIDKNPSYCSSYRFSHCVYSYRKQPQISPFTFHHNVRTISERNAVQIRYRLLTGQIVLHICTRLSRDRASAEEGEISILIKRGNKNSTTAIQLKSSVCLRKSVRPTTATPAPTTTSQPPSQHHLGPCLSP